MNYSLVGIVALLILLITHFEVIFKVGNIDKIPAFKQYRLFIIATALFYGADIVWGIFDYIDNDIGAYIDTVFYFLLMSTVVFLWARYIIKYLEQRPINGNIATIIAALVPAFCISIVISNFFQPVFFEYANGQYTPHAARYVFLFSLMSLYIIVAIYALISIKFSKKKLVSRCIIISIFGFVMAFAILLQLLYPSQPLYTLGCAVCIALIKAHVVNTEKNELAVSLSKVNKQVEKQSEELADVMELAYSDPLTGAKSKHAYVEFEDNIDKLIRNEEIDEFAVLVFDVNYLKNVNDALGHDVGDRYLIESCTLIKEFFKYSDVYRYGGDEFIIILEGVDYAKRKELVESFRKTVVKNKSQDKPVIATGLSEYNKGKDHSLRSVFNRADKDMYMNKKFLKSNDAK